MNILVTGAAGFIGTHLWDELEQHGHRVIPADRRFGGDLRDPDNVRDLFTWAADHHVDQVVHLAAKVGRLFGEDDLTATVTDNVTMTALIARACGDHGIPLAYASTSEVYGDLGEQTAREDGPMALPHNAYGLSKRQGEEFCRLYAPDQLLLLRFSMPYGPGHPPGRGRAALTNFLHQAAHGEPIPVHKGSERAWCWIGDTVRAVRMLVEAGHTGAWNIGRDDNATPMRHVAELACDLVGASHDLISDTDPPGRQTVVKRLSTEKLRAIGWEPTVDLEEGMRRVLAYVQKFDRNGKQRERAAA